MKTIDDLLRSIQAEAERAEFPIDSPVYERAGREPLRPILFAGALDARVCVVGRDLGKDEVAAAEPLIGAAGRLVRAGVYEAWNGAPPPKSDRRVESALAHVLLTNTVPYKPPGNKAYAAAVKERFRPYLAEFLTTYWRGDRLITLGTEAFEWFAPYADRDQVAALWKRDDRYESELDATVTSDTDGRPCRKAVKVCPLPHPSPLNQRWYSQFPGLLAARLKSLVD